MTEPAEAANGRRASLLAIAFAAAIAVALFASPYLRPTGLMRDFSAFYCAGAAVDAGDDPYRAEPIGACERSPKPFGLSRGIEGLSVPAPLPPFALALFAAIARLPYGPAASLWATCIVLSFAVSVTALRRLGISAWTSIAALALTDGYASLALGQIAPVAVASILGAAVFLERERPELAGILAAGALVEPHLALGPALAVAIARPKARTGLVLTTLALLAIGVIAVGPATALEYVRDVLPAHARSEIASTRQFSLTAVLAELGLGPGIALVLGDLSYVVALGLGIAVGIRLAGRFGLAHLVLAPAAFAVVGGPFVHIVQMAGATPLALLLARRQQRFRAGLEAATTGLCAPWVQFATLGGILVPLAAIAAATLAAAARRPVLIAASAGLAAVALFAGIEALVTPPPPDPIAELIAHADPRALAEASWSRYVAAAGSADRASYDLARLPTWLGAIATVTVALILALGGKGSDDTSRIRDTSS